MSPKTLSHELVITEKLARDYLRSSSILKQVFPKHFRAPSARRFKIDRQKIVVKLLDYNRKMNAPERVIQNIRALLQPETYTIMTGQQPGVFTGPLYTLYKAISATVICDRLSDNKQSFVPIFWNASEDHDFSEVNHIVMFRKNRPFEIHYKREPSDVSFSNLNLDKSELERMLSVIDSVSPESEFKTKLLKDIDGIVQKSSTISDFFSRLLLHLLGESGLIVIEPTYLRDLMTSVFAKLIERPTECTRILNETGSTLRKLGYTPKIHKKPAICNFFIVDANGKRLRVTYDGKFHVADKTFSKTELLQLLFSDPHRFSANAITRPITQDFIFPTFAYVAGPNEIAYQAQLKGIYNFFGLEMPVIFPRFGATIVEKKVSKILLKYNLGIEQMRNPDETLKKLAERKIACEFNSFRREVLKDVDEMTTWIMSLDDTCAASCSLARGRILKTLGALENRISTKLKNNNLVATRQIMKTHNNLFPHRNLQERQINVLEYLMKFGNEFIENVHRNFMEADYGEHVVISC